MNMHELKLKAQMELLEEARTETVEQIKQHLQRIAAAKETLRMLEAKYALKLREMEDKLSQYHEDIT